MLCVPSTRSKYTGRCWFISCMFVCRHRKPLCSHIMWIQSTGQEQNCRRYYGTNPGSNNMSMWINCKIVVIHETTALFLLAIFQNMHNCILNGSDIFFIFCLCSTEVCRVCSDKQCDCEWVHSLPSDLRLIFWVVTKDISSFVSDNNFHVDM